MINLFDSLQDDSNKILPFDFPQIQGFSYSWNNEYQGFDIIIPNGKLFYAKNFFNQKISDRSVEYFLENDKYDIKSTDWAGLSYEEFVKINFTNILWKQDFINLYGRKPLPRLTSWYGDEGKSYSYSGIKSDPNQWNKGLLYIKEQIEKVAQVNFNSVLLNWYRDGQDYLNWHADDEKELGINPIIASVNFGETRDFQIKNNQDHSLKVTIPLEHGTLLIMGGEMQHFWQHAVPKRAKVKKSRFNLTFRIIH